MKFLGWTSAGVGLKSRKQFLKLSAVMIESSLDPWAVGIVLEEFISVRLILSGFDKVFPLFC